MADTIPNIPLPKGGAYIDLYDASGISIGTQIVVQSLSAGSVRLVTKATTPDDTDGHQLLVKGQEAVNTTGDSGAWGSSQSGGIVNVRVSP